MKFRSSFLLWVVLVIGATILVVLLARSPASKPDKEAGLPSERAQGAAGAPNQRSPEPSPPALRLGSSNEFNASAANEVEKQYRNGQIDKRQAMTAILSLENHVPIIFYGKLEDQFGCPVVGAHITGSTIIDSGNQTGSRRVIAVSDAAGKFTLDGGKGESLGVMPRKEGYLVATKDTEFKYSHLYQDYHVPDPNNPVLIKMWRLQGTEKLVNINCRFRLPYSSTPIHLDLLTGNVVSSAGDMRIIVNRSPGTISAQNPLDWTVTIEAISGGLMDANGTEGVTYFAPETGYAPSKTIRSSDRLPEGGLGGFHAGFYLKTRGGQVYSKLGLSFGINMRPDDPIYVEVSGVANTNWSRNFEADAPARK